MKYISQELNQWAMNEIKGKYEDDVALLIGHQHWKIPIDGDEVAFNFFIPETDRGYELAETFIIDGIGYDLFPMSWERVEGLAELNESLTTCLADGAILYAKDDAAVKRFEKLQEELASNLSDPTYVYIKGLEKVNAVMDLYKNLVFESSLGAIRKASGYIVDFLSQAIMMANGSYLLVGPQDLKGALEEAKQLPEGFIRLYEEIVKAKDKDALKAYSYELIQTTRQFFEDYKPKNSESKEINLSELTGWYEEGTYTFRRIYYYCDQNDYYNAFAWGYNFQQEFDYLHAELGLDQMDLMSVYDYEDLENFKKRAKDIEQYILEEIDKNGLSLCNYSSLDEFLEDNQ